MKTAQTPNKKTLVIRADATSNIGTGHIMRCIALGQAWQDNGGRVTFISHCESDALKKRVSDEGFDFISLNKHHPNPSDLECTLNTLHALSTQGSENNRCLVVDGYHFDASYQKQIKKLGHKLLWIDDYGHAAHYYADIVLNQNISAKVSFYNDREPHTRLLLGTRYALLRREFKQWQGWHRENPGTARKVLVTLGGGDPDNVTLKVMNALEQVHISGLEAKIIVGPANPNLQTLVQVAGAHSFFQIVTNAESMAELMAWADVAITAGGSTCWEMALLGLPNMIMYFADNQHHIAEKLHEAGAAFCLGWSHQLTIESIKQHIEDMLLSQDRRKGYSKKSQALVDGTGVQRVCREII